MRKLILLLVPIILFTSCNGKSNKDAEVIKIAFLPILDSLPFYVAEKEGFFSSLDIQVKAIPVNSAVERDQAIQSGAVNGMLNDLLSTAIFNKEKPQIEIVAIAREAGASSPVFRILASPGRGINTPQKLSGVPVAVSKNSIIEYLTSRILEEEGLSPSSIVVKSVPVIPERFQLLMKGEIKAATLPDPLAQAAIKNGAIQIIDDTSYPQYSCSVLSFTNKFLKNNKKEVKDFIKAWNKAADAINNNPLKYRELFYEKVGVPEIVKDSYNIPRFPVGKIPSETQWENVVNWLNEKGIITSRPSYSDAVENFYVP